MTENTEVTQANNTLKLLVVGGYGTFGGRLVDLLKNEIRLEIVVAGRDSGRAVAFCAAREDALARLEPVMFDRTGDVLEQLRTLSPHILVDASGPFQAYGEERYRLIEACIACGIHYLDLADGSDFVAGVRDFDAAARTANVYVLSGVSSFPVLTAAVVRHLTLDMLQIASIRGGIAPSPHARVGENVIRAIAGYAGQPVALIRNGKPAVGHAFAESVRFTIAPPGRIPLRNTMFSLVDVPDLRALPERWPVSETVWMGAGPLPEILHRALIGLAWLVRWGVLGSLSPLASLMHFATNHLRFGEHRGGMFVAVEGTLSNGEAATRSWHLVAEGEDGPFIPSMAIEAIVRKTLRGDLPAPGARTALCELGLDDYETLFKHRKIHFGIRDEKIDSSKPLFSRLLGEACQQLPAAVLEMHTFSSEQLSEGRCNVDRGSSVVSNWVASLFGFPTPAEDLHVAVRFECKNGVERWTRKFGTRVFSSNLKAGRGTNAHLLCERIGLFDFAQALVLEGDRLRLLLRRWSVLGIQLPLWLAPRSNSYETEQDGRFHFHVEISHPLIGLIVRYRGWLVVDRNR